MNKNENKFKKLKNLIKKFDVYDVEWSNHDLDFINDLSLDEQSSFRNVIYGYKQILTKDIYDYDVSKYDVDDVLIIMEIKNMILNISKNQYNDLNTGFLIYISFLKTFYNYISFLYNEFKEIGISIDFEKLNNKICRKINKSLSKNLIPTINYYTTVSRYLSDYYNIILNECDIEEINIDFNGFIGNKNIEEIDYYSKITELGYDIEGEDKTEQLRELRKYVRKNLMINHPDKTNSSNNDEFFYWNKFLEFVDNLINTEEDEKEYETIVSDFNFKDYIRTAEKENSYKINVNEALKFQKDYLKKAKEYYQVQMFKNDFMYLISEVLSKESYLSIKSKEFLESCKENYNNILNHDQLVAIVFDIKNICDEVNSKIMFEEVFIDLSELNGFNVKIIEYNDYYLFEVFMKSNFEIENKIYINRFNIDKDKYNVVKIDKDKFYRFDESKNSIKIDTDIFKLKKIIRPIFKVDIKRNNVSPILSKYIAPFREYNENKIKEYFLEDNNMIFPVTMKNVRIDSEMSKKDEVGVVIKEDMYSILEFDKTKEKIIEDDEEKMITKSLEEMGIKVDNFGEFEGMVGMVNGDINKEYINNVEELFKENENNRTKTLDGINTSIVNPEIFQTMYETSKLDNTKMIESGNDIKDDVRNYVVGGDEIKMVNNEMGGNEGWDAIKDDIFNDLGGDDIVMSDANEKTGEMNEYPVEEEKEIDEVKKITGLVKFPDYSVYNYINLTPDSIKKVKDIIRFNSISNIKNIDNDILKTKLYHTCIKSTNKKKSGSRDIIDSSIDLEMYNIDNKLSTIKTKGFIFSNSSKKMDKMLGNKLLESIEQLEEFIDVRYTGFKRKQIKSNKVQSVSVRSNIESSFNKKWGFLLTKSQKMNELKVIDKNLVNINNDISEFIIDDDEVKKQLNFFDNEDVKSKSVKIVEKIVINDLDEWHSAQNDTVENFLGLGPKLGVSDIYESVYSIEESDEMSIVEDNKQKENQSIEIYQGKNDYISPSKRSSNKKKRSSDKKRSSSSRKNWHFGSFFRNAYSRVGNVFRKKKRYLSKLWLGIKKTSIANFLSVFQINEYGDLIDLDLFLTNFQNVWKNLFKSEQTEAEKIELIKKRLLSIINGLGKLKKMMIKNSKKMIEDIKNFNYMVQIIDTFSYDFDESVNTFEENHYIYDILDFLYKNILNYVNIKQRETILEEYYFDILEYCFIWLDGIVDNLYDDKLKKEDISILNEYIYLLFRLILKKDKKKYPYFQVMKDNKDDQSLFYYLNTCLLENTFINNEWRCTLMRTLDYNKIKKSFYFVYYYSKSGNYLYGHFRFLNIVTGLKMTIGGEVLKDDNNEGDKFVKYLIDKGEEYIHRYFKNFETNFVVEDYFEEIKMGDIDVLTIQKYFINHEIMIQYNPMNKLFYDFGDLYLTLKIAAKKISKYYKEIPNDILLAFKLILTPNQFLFLINHNDLLCYYLKKRVKLVDSDIYKNLPYYLDKYKIYELNYCSKNKIGELEDYYFTSELIGFENRKMGECDKILIKKEYTFKDFRQIVSWYEVGHYDMLSTLDKVRKIKVNQNVNNKSGFLIDFKKKRSNYTKDDLINIEKIYELVYKGQILRINDKSCTVYLDYDKNFLDVKINKVNIIIFKNEIELIRPTNIDVLKMYEELISKRLTKMKFNYPCCICKKMIPMSNTYLMHNPIVCDMMNILCGMQADSDNLLYQNSIIIKKETLIDIDQ